MLQVAREKGALSAQKVRARTYEMGSVRERGAREERVRG
jgi:hypothetical protein